MKKLNLASVVMFRWREPAGPRAAPEEDGNRSSAKRFQGQDWQKQREKPPQCRHGRFP